MKKNVSINIINKFYLNLCDKNEPTQVINLLRNPARDKLLTMIMKKQWDSIEIDDLHIDQNIYKYREN